MKTHDRIPASLREAQRAAANARWSKLSGTARRDEALKGWRTRIRKAQEAEAHALAAQAAEQNREAVTA
jgi:hypothetical protein